MMAANDLAVWRCPNCGHILAEVKIDGGTIRVKCSCNQVSTLQVVASPQAESVKLDGM